MAYIDISVGASIGGGGDALTSNPLSQFAATTSLQLKGVISDETGSGALVFATSPTLVTPDLGTPSALVGTNITGTAAGFTAGTVTTNANLTGHITSSGNAAVLGSFTSLQLRAALTDETGSGSAVFATSATLTSPLINTPTLTSPVLGAGSATSITFGLGTVGAPSIAFTGDTNTGIWSSAADSINVSTAGVERMCIDSGGIAGIGTSTLTTGLLNVHKQQAAYTYVNVSNDGTVGAGTGAGFLISEGSTSRMAFRYERDATGSVSIVNGGNGPVNFVMGASYAAATVIKVAINQAGAVAATKGSASLPEFTFIGDTNTGMFSSGADVLNFSTAATERMRIDSVGAVGIGTTSLTGYGLRMAKAITGATVSYQMRSDGVIQSDVTNTAVMFSSTPGTLAASFTLGELQHFSVSQGTFGAGSTVTSQFGFYVGSTMTGATNNYGFYGNLSAAANRYNAYMVGTAQNLLQGVTGIGIAPAATSALTLAAGTTGVSSLNVPHGSAPSSPVNGDIWTTTAGLYVRINGVTVGPLT